MIPPLLYIIIFFFSGELPIFSPTHKPSIHDLFFLTEECISRNIILNSGDIEIEASKEAPNLAFIKTADPGGQSEFVFLGSGPLASEIDDDEYDDADDDETPQ